MRAIKLLFFFPVCFVCILSCATRTGSESRRSATVAENDILYVNFTDGTKFVLLPPEGIEQAMDMAQYLSAEFRGQNYFLNAWVMADENSIEMTFFNEMGANIGELSYSSGAIQFSSDVIPKPFLRHIKPEYVIADFQLCFYDPVLLNRSLKDCGLVLEITYDSSSDGYRRHGTRRILSGNEVIIEIIKTGNTVELVNHLRGYSYTMEGDFHE